MYFFPCLYKDLFKVGTSKRHNYCVSNGIAKGIHNIKATILEKGFLLNSILKRWFYIMHGFFKYFILIFYI